MRITANQLRRIIREELDRMDEKNEDMKPGVKSVLDKYESEGDKLAGPSTPEKEKKRQQLMKDTASGLKKAGVTGQEDIGMQLNLYYESIGRGVSDSTHSLAIELDKLQKQMQEAFRRLLRRL